MTPMAIAWNRSNWVEVKAADGVVSLTMDDGLSKLVARGRPVEVRHLAEMLIEAANAVEEKP